MNFVTKMALFTFLILSFGTQGLFFNSFIDLDSHFETYSEFSQTHHDNIADDDHSHTHKHSEDGEEHEHHHSHSGTPQQSVKLLGSISFELPEVIFQNIENNYSSKVMNSTEHPSLIFRPPIV